MRKIIILTSAILLYINYSYSQVCSAENLTVLPVNTISEDDDIHIESVISLPTGGQSLTITNNANVTFNAGNHIKLRPGFKAMNGTNFTAKIADCIGCERGNIELVSIVNAVIPGEDFCFFSNNADSYHFRVYNRGGDNVYEKKGTAVTNGLTVIPWDGGNVPQAVYVYQLLLTNYCGDSYLKNGDVTAFKSLTLKLKSEDEETLLIENSALSNNAPFISPNPAQEKVIVTNEKEMKHIKIITLQGVVVYDEKVSTLSHEINLNAFSPGTYALEVSGADFTKLELLVITK